MALAECSKYCEGQTYGEEIHELGLWAYVVDGEAECGALSEGVGEFRLLCVVLASLEFGCERVFGGRTSSEVLAASSSFWRPVVTEAEPEAP